MEQETVLSEVTQTWQEMLHDPPRPFASQLFTCDCIIQCDLRNQESKKRLWGWEQQDTGTMKEEMEKNQGFVEKRREGSTDVEKGGH